ncbi:agmatinase [Halarchaeum nitratireducens]|uniref:Agmatinase n=1 Tax=Halarchaeum nitratireducens TaxID=489913 RepID=A0A830G866_9EURY|nr:agmatinase [Halarchaeum nitratireducens]GGN10982.1 agmatinase [Halarchaeum nitratireducens]
MRDPLQTPRFAGVATFMRSPHRPDLDGTDADVAFLGVPYDDATTYRSGARFGPRAIRAASTLLKPYNPATDTSLGDLSIVDHDDAPVVPGYTEATFEAVESRVASVLARGVFPVLAGGDHSTTLPVLRAVAAEHGPVSLVQFDAHADLWMEYFGKPYNHGTTVHHAIEEGLIDPETSIRIGDRGGLYGAADVERFADAGIDYFTMDEFAAHDVASIGDAIAAHVDGPTFATIDVDVVDPAFAPGTGTPMPGGMSARELLSLTRDLVGVDVVEVAPPYDHGDVTAVLAANVLFEALCAAREGGSIA